MSDSPQLRRGTGDFARRRALPGLFILESGWCKAIKTGLNGREQVLQKLKPGDVFNAISVFTVTANQATVIALETSHVWIVQQEVLLRMMDEHPPLTRQVVKNLAGRGIHLTRMVEELSLRSGLPHICYR